MTGLNLSPEQSRLVDGLAWLIERRGHEPFLTNPVLRPTPEYFPDPVPRTVGEVRRLLGTLMTYAGLEDLAMEVHLYNSADRYRIVGADGREYTPPHAGAAAFFAGIQDGVCHYGLDQQITSDPELLLGALAHEVAHAYRSFHGLVAMNRDVEEQLTDLTTVYLGFGVLTTSAAYDVHTSGRVTGYAITHSVSVRRAGYLPPEDMAFLLAVQLVIRGASSDLRRIADELPPFQRDALRSAFKDLAPASEDLAELVLKDFSSLANGQQRPRDHRQILRNRPQLRPSDTDNVLLFPEELRPAKEEGSGHTFRIQTSQTWYGAMVGGALALLIAMLVRLPIWICLPGGWVGYLIGGHLRRFVCTDRDCGAHMSEMAPTCPGCKRVVRRTVGHIHETLDD